MSPERSVGRTSGKSVQGEGCEADFLSLLRTLMHKQFNVVVPLSSTLESISDHLATPLIYSVVWFPVSHSANEIRAGIVRCSDCLSLHHALGRSSHPTNCDLTRERFLLGFLFKGFIVSGSSSALAFHNGIGATIDSFH